MLSIIKGISDYELKNELWSGAVDTMNTIIENNKTDDLMCLLEELFFEPIDITTINDFLWFEDDFIFEELNIKTDDMDNSSSDFCK